MRAPTLVALTGVSAAAEKTKSIARVLTGASAFALLAALAFPAAAPAQVTPELRTTIEARPPPAGVGRSRRSLHDERLLPRLRVLGGPALHALQHALAHRPDVGPRLVGEWGDCKEGLSVKELRSSYPYKTAEEHYNALLAKAKANGGPTIYDRDHPPPDGTATTTPAPSSSSSGASATTSKPRR